MDMFLKILDLLLKITFWLTRPNHIDLSTFVSQTSTRALELVFFNLILLLSPGLVGFKLLIDALSDLRRLFPLIIFFLRRAQGTFSSNRRPYYLLFILFTKFSLLFKRHFWPKSEFQEAFMEVVGSLAAIVLRI